MRPTSALTLRIQPGRSRSTLRPDSDSVLSMTYKLTAGPPSMRVAARTRASIARDFRRFGGAAGRAARTPTPCRSFQKPCSAPDARDAGMARSCVARALRWVHGMAGPPRASAALVARLVLGGCPPAARPPPGPPGGRPRAPPPHPPRHPPRPAPAGAAPAAGPPPGGVPGAGGPRGAAPGGGAGGGRGGFAGALPGGGGWGGPFRAPP